MNNEECLLRLYNSYPNSRYFTIINNNFRYTKENKIEEIALENIKFIYLNPNIFLLQPDDIFLIVYTLEVLNRNKLTDNDTEKVKKCAIEYLKLLDEFSIKEVDDEYKRLKWNMLCIPIYTSEDPRYSDYPASIIIKELIDVYVREKEGGRGNSRVLKNPNGSQVVEEPVSVSDFRNAGFIALALIVGVVAVTITYITTFLLNK